MMSLEMIEQMSRQAARRAAREGKYPLIVEQEDIEHARRSLSLGRIPRFGIPFLGTWKPRGWKATSNRYFVDVSGFGRPGEPALTQAEFVGKMRAGFAYALVEVGQFQAYVQEYTPPRRTP
jgi:hypothetical protein